MMLSTKSKQSPLICSLLPHLLDPNSQSKSKISDMADNSQSMSYRAGEAKGQAQEKASNMMDKAAGAAESAKESAQETGEQIKAKAEGAKEAVKDATGVNK